MLKMSLRSMIVMGAVSVFGLITLIWPLLVNQPEAELVQPPFVFMLLLPVVVIVAVVELTQGGLDPRVLAILGILAAVDAVMRGISAGTAGVELVFFLIILGGRVFGPAFGFMLGATSLFASALFTAGVGPWLPYQMLASAWLGAVAGMLPRKVRGKPEIAMLAVYGVVASYVYGALLNLQGWPTLAGITVDGYDGPLAFDPSAGFWENLQTFGVYTLLTSTTSFDTGRAITTAVAIIVLGAAVMTTLRRAARRAVITGTVVESPA